MATGEELASIDVPEQPKQIVLAADAVWVACDAGNALVRIDPGAAEVTDTIDVGDGPVELEFGFNSLWVRNRQFELVGSIPKPRSDRDNRGLRGEPFARPVVRRWPVWASVLGPAGMAAIDPGTNALAYEIPLPGARYMDSYWLDGMLWVSTASTNGSCRWTPPGPESSARSI